MTTTRPEPLVRTRFVQEWLANVQREEDPWRARFFGLLPREERRAIEESSRVGWMPVRYHVLLADVLAQAFGPQRAHDYYRRAFASSLSGPIFGPLVKTGARLLGFTPGSFAKWLARGWEIAFKNAGSASGEVVGDRRAVITYRDLPEVCRASDAWLTSSLGSAYGVYDVVGCVGVVRQDLSRREEGIQRLELEWTDRIPR